MTLASPIALPFEWIGIHTKNLSKQNVSHMVPLVHLQHEGAMRRAT